MLKKAQNWYQQENVKNRKVYGEETLYTAIVESKILVHDEGDEQIGKPLALKALNTALLSTEKLIPHSEASEDSRVYIVGASLDTKSIQRG